MRRLWLWLRALLGRNRLESEMEREMRAHLDLEIEANLRAGMPPAEARRAALIAFGGVERAKEAVRDERGTRWLEDVLADVRYALRGFRQQRGYTAAIVLTLALGIGATTAMFTILNAVVLRSLPFPQPDRILSLSVSSDGTDAEVTDGRAFFAWAAQARTLEAIAAYGGGSYVVSTTAGPLEVRGTPATAPYFEVFGIRPLLGRTFTTDEDRRGGPAVVVISEQLWRGQFAADSTILGRSILIDGEPTTIVGVMPASFTTPRRAQLWRPYRLTQDIGNSMFYYSVVARMRPAVTTEMVRTELADIQRRLDPQRPANQRGLTPVVMTLHERRYGSTRRPLILLFAAVGVLLLITCANLANLALARGARREREFSLRLALGAHRWRLARYVLTESFVLSLAGAALGLALAASSIGYFARISPQSVGNAEGIGIDGTVLLFAIAAAAITSLLFGCLPAVSAARVSLSQALAAGSARAVGSVRHRALRRGVVVLELATALVLLIGAGLVARTFWSVTSIDPGIDPRGVVVARIQLPWRMYSDTTARVAMEELLERVTAVPGVQSAALSDGLPLEGAAMSRSFTWQGKPGPRFDVVAVTPGYFSTVGTRIVAGRAIDETDRQSGRPVALVSLALARALFPEREAVGELLGEGASAATIVGVTEDVRQRALEGAPSLVAFVPLGQTPRWHYLQLLVRSDASAAAVGRSVARIANEIDPSLPPPPVRSMEDVFAAEVAPRKFVLVLLGLFAGLAGVLAAIGLYGVLAYMVAEQTRELGIRVALGADRRRVLRHLMGHGAVLTASGLAIGLIAGGLAVRLLESLVYGLSVHDPWTFTGGVLLLGTVATAASVLPAWRASRVDPVVALRVD